MSDGITRRIIQTGPMALPLTLRTGIANVKLLHPSFEYVFFDDTRVKQFVGEEFPQYRDAFDSFRFPIQKYDFFRYLAIYRYGGFYLDLDVLLAEALTPLLSRECVFPFEELTSSKYFSERFQMDWQIGNYAFGAAPGHPFLRAVIDNCLRAKEDAAWVAPMIKGIPRPFVDEWYVVNTTGPGLVSRTYAEHPSLAERITILFPKDVRDPRSWHRFGEFGVHHMLGSWRKPHSTLSLGLRSLWEGWRYFCTFTQSRRRGPTRGAPRPLHSELTGADTERGGRPPR
jgi:hypothetical protein